MAETWATPFANFHVQPRRDLSFRAAAALRWRIAAKRLIGWANKEQYTTMEPRQVRRCGALARPDGGVCWRLWAPYAKEVELVLFDGNQRRPRRMTPDEEGYFSHVERQGREGQRYAYRMNNGPDRPDPASLWQPDGVHQPSAVVLPGRFCWSDQQWRGVRRQDLVIYELHVGTFTPEGTFDAVIPRLQELRKLGVTAIEIMPVAQFPGRRNWGYDGTYLYAAQNSYGGPQGLQRLVDACHAAGLAIFLDVVYNHLGPEGNYLREFGPYFSDRYRTFWGQALNYDSAGCDSVRDFIIDNARMWIEEFHMDGLRLDAVHAIYDLSPHHILEAIKEAVDECGRRLGWPIHVIAESDLNDPRLLLPPERGGYNLDAQWSDDFHHAVHAYLTGERQGYYEDFGRAQDLAQVLQQTFLYAGTFSRHRNRRHGAPSGNLPGDRFVVSIQNHDQVGNRARGDRFSKLLSPAGQRLAGSLLLLSPHIPLLFMGEEYGEERPFQFFCSFSDGRLIDSVRKGRRHEFAAFAWQGEVPDPQSESTFNASRLSWSWPAETRQAGLRRLYADLLAARRRWPALQNLTDRTTHLLPAPDQAAVLELIRGVREPELGKTLQIYFNLTDQKQRLPHPRTPGDVVLFSSEAHYYGGERRHWDEIADLLPFECVVFGAADLRRSI
jgi:maltooligosyltrehalose trehalohydrolase